MSEADHVRKKIDEIFDSMGRPSSRAVGRREVSVRMSDGKIVVTDRDSDDSVIQTTTMSYRAAKDHVVQLQNAMATIDAAVAAGIVKIEG